MVKTPGQITIFKKNPAFRGCKLKSVINQCCVSDLTNNIRYIIQAGVIISTYKNMNSLLIYQQAAI